MNNSRFLLFFALLITYSTAFALSNLHITGQVVDEHKKALEWVNVFDEKHSKSTVTNQNGFFDIQIESQDSISLKFSQVGFQTQRITVFPGVANQFVTVILKTYSKELDEVNVIGQKVQTTSIDYIDATKLKLVPNAAGGIESMLIAFAGVASSNELSSQYNVRGGNFDENMVYVNGVEVYRPLLIRSGQQEGLSFINPDMVKNVSFSSGGFDARYGDKMSSVLDIQYKTPQKFESTVSASFLGATAYIGTSNSKFSQMHGFRYKTNSYLIQSLDTKADYKPQFFDYQTNLTYQLNSRLKLSFLANFSQNSYLFIPRTRETAFGTSTEKNTFNVFFEGMEKDLFRTSFSSLSADYIPSKGLTLSFSSSMFYTNESENYDIDGEYVLNKGEGDGMNSTSIIGVGKYHQHARNQLDATVSSLSHIGEFSRNQNQLKWGVTLQNERIKDRISEWEWQDSIGYSLPSDSTDLRLFYNLKSKNQLVSNRITSFVQDTYKWNFEGMSFLVTGGYRANYWTFNKELILSPRLSVAILPHWERNFNFRFSTGLYHQAPFYKEIRDTLTDAQGNVSTQLNSNILSPRSMHFVLGTDYYFKSYNRPFKFTTEVYLKLADRMIFYSVDNVQLRYSGLNDSRAYTAGIDIKLNGEFLPGTDSWINLSLMSSKMKFNDDFFVGYKYTSDSTYQSYTYQKGWYPSSNEQRYVFSMLFQDYLPNNPSYKLHLRFIYSDGLPFGPPRDVRLQNVFRSSSYKRVDIGASRVLVKGNDPIMNQAFFKHIKSIWLNFEVFNLLDISNVNSYYWVTNIDKSQVAVPNYLTRRMFQLKLIVDFK